MLAPFYTLLTGVSCPRQGSPADGQLQPAIFGGQFSNDSRSVPYKNLMGRLRRIQLCNQKNSAQVVDFLHF